MNILSLFDGISCGQLALNKAGQKFDKYFASEIDKNAIKVTQHNFPNTIQLGAVQNIDSGDLPNIDLLIGGSPCTGFSFAGKQLNFEDEQSKLFFEFVRLKNEINPKYFLLENVRMKKEYQDVISEYLGVEPVLINSNLFSAQNRVRNYWTNIENISMPVDRQIKLSDILEEKRHSFGLAIRGRKDSSGKYRQHYEINWVEKSNCLTTVKIVSMVFIPNTSFTKTDELKVLENEAFIRQSGTVRHFTQIERERLQTLPDFYTSSVSDSQAVELIGNGWTVDVIAHIFKGLKE